MKCDCGAFGLIYCSGVSRTKGSNRSACLRNSTKTGSCPSGVTASPGTHRTFTFSTKLSTGTDSCRRAGPPPRGAFTQRVSARPRQILLHNPL